MLWVLLEKHLDATKTSRQRWGQEGSQDTEAGDPPGFLALSRLGLTCWGAEAHQGLTKSSLFLLPLQLHEDELQEAVLLVFANKQVMPKAMAGSELTEKLWLQALHTRTVSAWDAVPIPIPMGWTRGAAPG